MTVALVAVAAGCGKRGAPLPPLPRVPAAVAEWSVLRSDETVALTLVVPAANVSGDTPGDVAAVEIYAVTAERPPTLEAGRVPAGAVLVTTIRVRRPLPPVPASAPPGVPTLPREPGSDQGERVTVRERLTPELRVTTPVLPTAHERRGADGTAALPHPVVFVPAGAQLKRHYIAVAVSRRGARSAWSAVRSVPVGAVSGAPSQPRLTYDAATVSLSWTPARDARLVPAAAGDLLESRALGPVPTPTRYHVYTAANAAADPAAIEPSARLTAEPLAATTVSAPGVTFGQARCFVVRGVDTLDGVDVEGPASPVGCVTPIDSFPPPSPTALEAVGGAGVVSLIWEGVEAPDLAGYLVLRGVAGGEPTTVVTPDPISGTSFEDRTVTPGTRYVYVVVAIDSATPPNRSAPSNRAEETARQ